MKDSVIGFCFVLFCFYLSCVLQMYMIESKAKYLEERKGNHFQMSLSKSGMFVRKKQRMSSLYLLID